MIRSASVETAFAFRRGRTISVGQFLSDVEHLARLLPARRYLLNLCSDRYRFAVGFSAALVRGQVSLLPPDHSADLVAHLQELYKDVYCLTEEAGAHPSLATVVYPASAVAESTSVAAVPAILRTQLAAIVFTSGSTGKPVPSEKTWGGLVNGALAEAECFGLDSGMAMALVGTVPPQHMYGLESTVLLAMQNGLPFDAGRPFYPADIVAALEALPRPRALVTTPVHLRLLLAADIALPEADFLLSATAPLSPQLASDAEKRFRAPLYEVYGCTEAGQVAARRTIQTATWRCMKGVTLRQGPEGTFARGGHIEQDVLLCDVIELLNAETFLLHGRVADLVNIAGKRTSLANLNYHLNSIEGVQDGVFMMPDDSGEAVLRLIAFVVAPKLNAEAVMSRLRQRIDAAFLPRPLYFAEELPRDPNGKVTRRTLELLAARHSQRQEKR